MTEFYDKKKKIETKLDFFLLITDQLGWGAYNFLFTSGYVFQTINLTGHIR